MATALSDMDVNDVVGMESLYRSNIPLNKADTRLALMLAANVPMGNQLHPPFKLPLNRDNHHRNNVPNGARMVDSNSDRKNELEESKMDEYPK